MIKVMVALSGRIYSEAISGLLDYFGGIELIGVPRDEAYLSALVNETRPDVILTDMKVLGRFSGAPEGARFIILGVKEELAQALPNDSIRGFLDYGTDALTLQTAVKAVAKGVLWFDGESKAGEHAGSKVVEKQTALPCFARRPGAFEGVERATA